MFEITTTTPVTAAKGPPGMTVECLLSETLTVAAPGIAGIVLRDGPENGATMEGTAITFTKPGRYWFVVATAHLGLGDLHVMVCEDACLARIPGLSEDAQWIPATDLDRRKRGILRSLAANAPFFDGTAASLISQPLAPYGA